MNIENCIEDMNRAAQEGGRLACDMRSGAQVLSEETVQMGIVKKFVKQIDVSYLVQQLMLEILRERNSVCGVLARERDDGSRFLEEDFNQKPNFSDGQYTLIVNPIDGKKNYSEPECETSDNYGSCVHLAKGREIIAGATHLPELDATITTLRGGGTFLNDERVNIEDDSEFSFDNLVRAHTLGDKLENLFTNNPYPRSASAILLGMLRQEMKSWLVGGVTVLNFGSSQTAYEEAGGVVRDADGHPVKTSDYMKETDRGLILQGFIGMAPSDEYYKTMMDEIKLRNK